jgi:hypothetical protein
MSNLRKDSTRVEINVYGDAINSTIVGIDLGKRSFKTSDGLFRKVLFEYLGLPTLREVATRVDLNLAKSRNHVRTFDFAKSSSLLRLWMAVLQDHYGFADPSTFMLDAYDARGQMRSSKKWTEAEKPLFTGTWVRLKNLQLSSFVNRAPGKFFLGGWRFQQGHDANEVGKFPVSQRMWTWEDYAVRTIGIGDVRLGPLDGFVMLQAGCPSNAATSATDAGGATLSPLGFPVLVEERLYKRVKPMIDEYGVVFLDEFMGQLAPAPENTGLIWAPGIPKSCLVAVDRASISEPSIPRKAFSSIWTVATNDDRSHFHYCVWGFQVGEKGYRAGVKAAADTIAKAMAKRRLHALFECDCEQNWFSEAAEFGPDQIKALAKHVARQERLRREISINDIDAGAEHTVADAVKKGDPETTAQLSRAFQMLQMGMYQESLAATEAFLKAHPRHPFALYLKGANLYCLGKGTEARPILASTLTTDLSYNLQERTEHLLRLIDGKD